MSLTDRTYVDGQASWPAQQFFKITKPPLSGVHSRKRVHELFDEACRSPTVWVCAPAGSGKTMAVASYIDSRQLPALWYQIDSSDGDLGSFFDNMNLAMQWVAPHAGVLPRWTDACVSAPGAFAAMYFRELFRQLPDPSVIVFDNYQEVGCYESGQGSALCDVLLLGLMQAPVGTTMIFVSREEPPAAFARLRTTRQMALLDWEAIGLTEDESAAIVGSCCTELSSKVGAAQQLHSKTRGWVTGLLLLLEHCKSRRAGDGPALPDALVRADTLFAPETRLVFDYFEYELLRHVSAAEREFLLTTALLPIVDLESARAIVQDESSDALFTRVTRRNLFTIKHADGAYEYHPMFRSYLLASASQYYGEQQFRERRLLVGQLLAERGVLDAAIELLLQAREWQSAIDLMLANAGTLIEQGRAQTLSRWLRAVPESVRTTHAWLLYWMSFCDLLVNPAEARNVLQRALELFESQDDAAPLIRCWCGIIDSFLIEWKDLGHVRPWVNRFHSFTSNRPQPHPTVMADGVFSYISALLWVQPDHPDLAIYAQRAESIFHQESNADERFSMAVIRLLPYHRWAGDLGKFKRIYSSVGASTPPKSVRPLARLNACVARAQMGALSGTVHEAAAAVSDGLAIADASGLHMCDVVLCSEAIWAHIGVGDTVAAESALSRMSAAVRCATEEAHFRHFIAVLLIHEGQAKRAIDEATRALELSGYYIGTLRCTICLSAALLAAGDLDGAMARLDEAREMAERMQSDYFLSTCSFLDAQIQRLCGNRQGAVQRLSEFLEYAKKYGVALPGYVPRAEMATLLSFALGESLHVEVVQDLITRARMTPPSSNADVNWPWPIKIFSLGRFLVLKDGLPVVGGGKAQNKPLELLGALIAHGGRNVGMNNLAQLLWPDTDGDIGRANLRTTLLRLRRLIGDAAVTQQGSALSLSAEHCWLDLWAFERICDSRTDGSEPAERIERMCALYAGTFLPDKEEPWIINQRERLRTKALRMILDIGQQFESTDKLAAAIDVYQKGIEVDSLAEELYRRLMRCYLRTNRSAEALTLYQRYRTLLSRSLQIEPSAETRSLFHKIQRLAM